MSCERWAARSTRQPAGGGLGANQHAGHAAELATEANRGVEKDAGVAERFADVFEQVVEMNVVPVEAIDDQHAGQAAAGRFVEHAPRC